MGFGKRGRKDGPILITADVEDEKSEKRTLRFVIIATVAVIAAISWLRSERSAERQTATATPAPKSDVENQAVSLGQNWVISDRLMRRTCPSTSCGIVGKLFFREGVSVLEIDGGWGRVTKYYDASCEGGRSAYVDSGPAACTRNNGIVEGQFAEWVQTANLSPEQPSDPAAGATGMAALIAHSDDYRVYKDAFIRAAQTLIADGRCGEADFTEWGGFMKSTNYGGPVYFTYCGGATLANKVYLDASTGRIFR